MKRLLMIAYHFPPQKGSSGKLRTLKFARYLPRHGWEPIILSVHPRAYPAVDENPDKEIPPGTRVQRAFGMDTARHLSIHGKYPRLLALPDRWATWWVGGLLSGLRLIRQCAPQAIWSTFPIATAHLIGLTLHRLTGLPWVTDFRDPMTKDGYPADAAVRKVYRWIETQAVSRSTGLVFTTPKTRQLYQKQFPGLNPDRCLVIPNGYDEADFHGIGTAPLNAASAPKRPLRLLHSGLLYPNEHDRDPRPFFRALVQLKADGRINASTLRVDLRAPGSDDYFAGLIKDFRIDDMVSLLPALPYQASLEDCARADGLLLFQGSAFDDQIPAKVYEYLRIGRPIIACTSRTGDTAELLRSTGGATIVEMTDVAQIGRTLPGFLDSIRSGTHPRPDAGRLSSYARHAQAQVLALQLDRLTGAE